MSWLDKLVEAAQKLGGLSAAAIFALVAMAQGYFIYKRERDTFEANEKWRLTRESQIRAEESQTIVVSKLVDVVSMNNTAINAQTVRIDLLSTILDERIPKGGSRA